MAAALVDNIRDGTFPNSDEILGKDANADGITSLLQSLASSKEQLKNEIRDASKTAGGDVDVWIQQAKKLQEDIRKCKTEARKIVEEHDRGESLRSSMKDASSKSQLLENEITFTKALEDEIQTISEITQVFNEIEIDLLNENPVNAVGKLVSLQSTIENISARGTRSLLSQCESDLRSTSQKKLEELLNARWTVTKKNASSTFTVHSDTTLQQSQAPNTPFSATRSILLAMQELQVLSEGTVSIQSTIESFVFSAISSTRPYPSSANVNEDSLVIIRNQESKSTSKVLSILQSILQFLHEKLPEQVRDRIAHDVTPKIVAELIPRWLDPTLPQELHDLQQLDPLRNQVTDLAGQLQRYSWPGYEALTEWIEQIPRGWLTRRRASSLDAVRSAYSLARGLLRPVERVEKQIVAPETSIQRIQSNDPDDSWNTNWDDEEGKQPRNAVNKGTDDDDVSGWDFDTEDSEIQGTESGKKAPAASDEDDGGDAWGWGDDDDNAKEEITEPDRAVKTPNRRTNGEKRPVPQSQELILKETYYITDIPDHVLEIIGKDMADSHELQQSSANYFETTSPATGLAGLPNLVLAFFRATAPTYYSIPSTNYTLSNINLYNDTLYIVQKLSEGTDAATFASAIDSLNKFARAVYSSELDVQRTILTDLLDGAQGFERCTTFPNSQACIDAVASTVDRVRQLHKEWSGVFGESHLLQSLGALITMIFGKVIKDVEEMEDISEAESKQLVEYCRQILTLENLFSSRLPDLTHGRNLAESRDEDGQDSETPPSQILLYVPNYLRFQYLQQILDSSLADIRYLWTEGELRLEFSAEEVSDLIKALFAESQHRRNALRTIREGTA